MGNSAETGEAGRPPWQAAIETLCCVNPECPDRGIVGHGNLAVCTGKGRGRWRILRCASCEKEFSERAGTALWGTKMPPEKVVAIAEHLKEGCGIRKTSRLVHASMDGVTGIAVRLRLHAKAVHDGRVRDISVKRCSSTRSGL